MTSIKLFIQSLSIDVWDVHCCPACVCIDCAPSDCAVLSDGAASVYSGSLQRSTQSRTTVCMGAVDHIELKDIS